MGPRLEEDSDVLVLGRPHHLGPVLELDLDLLLLLIDDPLDACRHGGELRCGALGRVVVPGVSVPPVRRRQEELHGAGDCLVLAVLAGVSSVTRLEPFPQAPSEQAREHAVHEIDDLLERAEVRRQLVALVILTLLPAGELVDGRLRVLEHRDVGIPERVDGLLGIADDEETTLIPPVAPEHPDDGPLDGVGVLELVDEEVAVALATLLQKVAVGVVGEQTLGLLQKIAEVEPAARLLPRLVAVKERAIERGEGVDGLCCRLVDGSKGEREGGGVREERVHDCVERLTYRPKVLRIEHRSLEEVRNAAWLELTAVPGEEHVDQDVGTVEHIVRGPVADHRGE